MSNILTELQAIISKNLPAEIGNQLKQRLIEAEDAEKKLSISIERIKELEKSLLEAQEMLKSFNSREEAASDVLKREAIIAEKERNYKVMEAELRAQNAYQRSEQMMELVRLVFKSPIYREEIGKTTQYTNIYEGNNSKQVPCQETTSKIVAEE